MSGLVGWSVGPSLPLTKFHCVAVAAQKLVRGGSLIGPKKIDLKLCEFILSYIYTRFITEQKKGFRVTDRLGSRLAGVNVWVTEL